MLVELRGELAQGHRVGVGRRDPADLAELDHRPVRRRPRQLHYRTELRRFVVRTFTLTQIAVRNHNFLIRKFEQFPATEEL